MSECLDTREKDAENERKYMTKLKLDLVNGVLEVEGEEAFVEKVYVDFKAKLAIQHSSRPIGETAKPAAALSSTASPSSIGGYSTLADCLSATGTSKLTDVDVVLIAAAYIQETQNLASSGFASQQVNKELKNVGRAPGNITNALQGSIDSKPQYVLQIKKSGNAQQARKLYRVTVEGMKRAVQLLTPSE